MQADNKWKDAFGKRLYDYEEAPLPETWNKINKEIKPARYRWWFWLPLLPLLVLLPWAIKNGKVNFDSASTGKTVALQPENRQPSLAGRPVNTTGQIAAKPNKGAGTNAISGPTESKSNPTQAGEQEKHNPANGLVETNVAVGETHLATVPVKPEKVKLPSLLLLPGSVKKPSPETAVSGKNSEKANPESQPNSGYLANTTKKNSSKLEENTSKKPAVVSAVSAAESPAQNLQNGMNSIEKAGITNISKTTNQIIANGESTFKHQEIAGTHNPDKEAGQQAQLAAGKENLQENNGLSNEVPAASLNPANQDSAILQPVIKPTDLSLNASADSAETKPETRSKKWAFALYATPQYAYQRVLANRQDEVMVLQMNNMNNFTSERLGFETGISTRYFISEKVQLNAGLQFTQLSQVISYSTASDFADSVVSYDQNGSVAMQVYNRQNQQQVNFRHYMVGAFLGGQYLLFDQLQVAAGLGSNIILQTRKEAETLLAPIEKVCPYVSVGFKYGWQLSEALTLEAGPVMQYYLQPVQQRAAPIAARPTTFGLNIGLQYRGKK